MKSILLVWKRRITQEALLEATAEILLCAVFGLLIGLMFGGIGAKVHHNLPTIFRIAATTTSVGLVFGATLVALRSFFACE